MQLLERDVGVDLAVAGEGAEAAIAGRHHPLAADDIGEAGEALGDELGVLDTSTNYVEHPELVAERLCRFADIVGKERVMGTSDCGFGTFAGYGKIDPDIAFKKLHAMAEGAAIASKRLWGRA